VHSTPFLDFFWEHTWCLLWDRIRRKNEEHAARITWTRMTRLFIYLYLRAIHCWLKYPMPCVFTKLGPTVIHTSWHHSCNQ
jgi:hypothetical protein